MTVERQRYQFPEGTVASSADTLLRDARVIGDSVRFAFTGNRRRAAHLRRQGQRRTHRRPGERWPQVGEIQAPRKGEGPAIETVD